ncbi:hypothetical protein [Geothermobacter hydrogeniphilus]|uniref:DUF4124 domain-containing protein n=1 Tax=Geothermobacter hydrogeniphilus TaxID=1969733 RepID=A0A1X0Y6D3_9BACT|nr:hypothetical protein [Geothermobacter hydrogeniphilus]ORJ60614.1 hypothetical protein B5V00_07195 [Geothermobacter hydrogeniphilus]
MDHDKAGVKAILCGLVVVLSGWSVAHADVFRCRARNGTMIFTNDPARIPRECRPLAAGEAPRAGFSVVPSSGRPISRPVVAVGESPRKIRQELQQRARRLVEEYRQALKERAAAGRSSGRRLAMRKIVELKKQRDSFRGEVDKAPISLRARREIEDILVSIPPS